MYGTTDETTPQPVHAGPSLFTVAIIALVFGAVGGVGGVILTFRANSAGRIDLQNLLGMNPVVAPSPVTTGSTRNGVALPDFINVANTINSSVVNINTLSKEENPYSFFFGSGSEVVHGLGTGIIVDDKGYILTNYHVVENATNIQVTVVQGDSHQTYKGEYIDGDKQEDLAVVKITASNLRPVKFGDSDKLQAGEWVMAMGNPFGFEHTVSVGVISALNRSLPVGDGQNMRGMIQTDASINPGNSGGPLVNIDGEVIGINSAIYVGNGNGPQASGLGFSIPSNRAKSIMEQLRNKQTIQHPYIGIRYQLITDDIRQSRHLTAKPGLVVEEVEAGSPAEKANLQKDDVITDADGTPMNQENSLQDFIAKQTVGKTITLTIYRDIGGTWTKMSVKVTLAERPVETPTEESNPTPEQPSEPTFPFPFSF